MRNILACAMCIIIMNVLVFLTINAYSLSKAVKIKQEEATLHTEDYQADLDAMYEQEAKEGKCIPQ